MPMAMNLSLQIQTNRFWALHYTILLLSFLHFIFFCLPPPPPRRFNVYSFVRWAERERERRRLSYWLQRGASSSSTSSSAAAAVLTPSSANISFFHPPLFPPLFACLLSTLSVYYPSIEMERRHCLSSSIPHHITSEGRGDGGRQPAHMLRALLVCTAVTSSSSPI